MSKSFQKKKKENNYVYPQIAFMSGGKHLDKFTVLKTKLMSNKPN